MRSNLTLLTLSCFLALGCSPDTMAPVDSGPGIEGGRDADPGVTDSDGDGLSDIVEGRYESDGPVDTDGDGR